MTTADKALIEQTVTVEFTVRLSAAEADLNVDLDDLQARIVDHVKKEFLGEVKSRAAARIYAQRGPGGYRYFPPEAVAEGFRWSKPDDRAAEPLTITLADLGLKES